MNHEDTVTKTDAVIVLANLMDRHGVLNAESKARAERAVQILNERNATHLVTCGWAYREDTDLPIADAFKAHIVENLGVSPDKVLVELRSRDTVGDAFFTKTTFAVPLSWKRICVVTSDYHVERTKEIFHFIYGDDFFIEVYGAEVPCDETILRNEPSSIRAFRETFLGVAAGNDRQIVQRLRERHPFYNGQVYAKI